MLWTPKLFLFLGCSFFIVFVIWRNYVNYVGSTDVPAEIYPPKLRAQQTEFSFEKKDNTLRNDEPQSSCSKEATEAGKGQKVISYSLFVPNEQAIPMFLKGVAPNLEKAKELYPGWLVRLYTDIPRSNFSELLSTYDHFYVCDISNIPGFGNLREMDPRSGRFLPLGDPMVDIFICRDLDSRIYPRERAAVQEWENSNYSIHVMRDHPYHRTPMLAGMWGAKNTLLGAERSQRLRLSLIEGAKLVPHKGWDQTMLYAVIYRELANETMAHDSYTCQFFPADGINLPFPTKRENGRFVGSILDGPNTATCPERCRKEPSWTDC